MEVLLKIKDVSKILMIREQAVRNLILDKELKAFRIRQTPKGKGDWRVIPADLRKYIAKRYNDGTREYWDKRCRGVKK